MSYSPPGQYDYNGQQQPQDQYTQQPQDQYAQQPQQPQQPAEPAAPEKTGPKTPTRMYVGMVLGIIGGLLIVLGFYAVDWFEAKGTTGFDIVDASNESQFLYLYFIALCGVLVMIFAGLGPFVKKKILATLTNVFGSLSVTLAFGGWFHLIFKIYNDAVNGAAQMGVAPPSFTDILDIVGWGMGWILCVIGGIMGAIAGGQISKGLREIKNAEKAEKRKQIKQRQMQSYQQYPPQEYYPDAYQPDYYGSDNQYSQEPPQEF